MKKLKCISNNRSTFTAEKFYILEKSGRGHDFVKDDRSNCWFLEAQFGGSQYSVKGGNKKLSTRFEVVQPDTSKRDIAASIGWVAAILAVAALAYFIPA